MAKKPSLGVRLEPDTYEAIRRAAARERRSMSLFVALLCEDWYAAQQTTARGNDATSSPDYATDEKR